MNESTPRHPVGGPPHPASLPRHHHPSHTAFPRDIRSREKLENTPPAGARNDAKTAAAERAAEQPPETPQSATKIDRRTTQPQAAKDDACAQLAEAAKHGTVKNTVLRKRRR